MSRIGVLKCGRVVFLLMLAAGLAGQASGLVFGRLLKTSADGTTPPAVAFNVKFCDQYGSCTWTIQTDSSGNYSYTGPLNPAYYSLFAWKDSENWGSQDVSEYSPVFGLGSPVFDPQVYLGTLYIAPRPLPIQALGPADGTFLQTWPCQTTLSWTDGLDAQRKTKNWPMSYDVFLGSVGVGQFPSQSGTSLTLSNLGGGRTYSWWVVAKLNVAANVFFTSRSATRTFSTSPNCQSTPVDDAAFLGQVSPPLTATVSSPYMVSVSMQNTGTTPWTEASMDRLGSQNPPDNQTWGTGRVMLAPGEAIAPGQSKTFTFPVTAPSVPGLYHFQWKMVHEGVRWFGALTQDVVVNVVSAAPVDGAVFVRQTAPPASMTLGSPAAVSVTMQNTGNTTWNSDFRLGSQSPQDNLTWGVGRVLASGVAPGQQATFTFNVTAPSTAGTYNFQWRMVHEGVRWFGDYTPIVAVSVAAAPPPLSPATGLSKEADPSRNLVWTPPANLTQADQVSYELVVRGLSPGTSCPTGCTFVPGAPAWYTLGPSIAPGSYTWTLQAKSVSRPYAAPVTGPTFAIPGLHAATGLAKEAPPSRNLVWSLPDNLVSGDSVTYNLWIFGGSNCASGCLYHPGAPYWYTMGQEIGAGSYTWRLQAVSASRPYALPVDGPAFTMP